jgi:hypothetical protein
MQGSPNESIGVYREALNLLHSTCWWSRVGRVQRRIRTTGRILSAASRNRHPAGRAAQSSTSIDHH